MRASITPERPQSEESKDFRRKDGALKANGGKSMEITRHLIY